jgi:hypothetical protein
MFEQLIFDGAGESKSAMVAMLRVVAEGLRQEQVSSAAIADLTFSDYTDKDGRPRWRVAVYYSRGER